MVLNFKNVLLIIALGAFVIAAVFDGTQHVFGMTAVGYIATGLAAWVLAKLVNPPSGP